MKPYFFKTLLLTMLLMTWFGRLNTKAQYLPPPTANMQTIPVGSWVIAMDNTYQGISGVFNPRAYGLAVELLWNDVPLRWIIKTGKQKDTIDVSLMGRKIVPSTGSILLNHFRAGPFVILPADTLKARAVVAAFNAKISTTTQKVQIYSVTTAKSADVRHILTHKPFIAVYDDGGNEKIHTDYLKAALVDTSRYRVIHEGYVLDSSSCFTYASTPHWNVSAAYTHNDSVRLNNLRSFLLTGGNFLGECEGIEKVENYGGSRYVSTNGITDISASITTQLYGNVDMPVFQMHGLYTQDGGSIPNFAMVTPASGRREPEYKGGYFLKNIWGDAALDTIININATKIGDVNQAGGTIIYLGGHSYSASSIGGVNGMRIYLNGMMLPARRIISNGIVSPGFNICQGDTIRIDFQPPSSGYTYTWTGPNSYTSTVEDPVIPNATTAKQGTYSAWIYAGEGCRFPYSTTVTVNPKPEFTATTTNSSICNDDSCTVSFTPSAGVTIQNWFLKDETKGGCIPKGAVLFTDASKVVKPDTTTTYVVIGYNTYGCKDTSCITITVDRLPKLTSPFPTGTPLCYGRGTVVNITPGNGGGTGCTETYQWKMDNGAWQPYTSGTVVGEGASDSVVVRANRSCATGCIGKVIKMKWSVASPQTVAAGHSLYNCTDAAGYIATLTATDPTPSTGAWSIESGPGSIASPASLSTTIGSLSKTGASTTVRWVVTNTYNCKDTTLRVITPPAVDTTLVSKYSNEYCLSCPIQNGTTYSYYDATGKLLASVTDSADAVAIGATTFCAQLPYNVSGNPAVGDVQSVNSWILDVGYLPQPYLPRAWNINTTNDAPMTINLYFTDAEVAALQGATLNNGGYYYFENPPELFLVAYPSTTDSFMPPKVSPDPTVISPRFTRVGGYWQISFEIDQSSTFYLYPTFWSNEALPVELTTFTAKAYKNSLIRLDWATASEKNNVRFDIERSTDGVKFDKIGEVAGNGNSRAVKNYQFDDEYVKPGIMYYYRLKQIDLDGKYTHSKIVQAKISGGEKLIIGEFMPNPASTATNITVSSVEDMTVNVSVYTLDGTKVKDLSYNVAQGETNLEIEVSGLSKGTYMVQVQTKLGTQIRKLVKLN